jgi:hypothetical protein
MCIWTRGLIKVSDVAVGPEEWWHHSLCQFPINEKRNVAALLMYTTQNIWKENNRRFFEGSSVPPIQVVFFIKEEM